MARRYHRFVGGSAAHKPATKTPETSEGVMSATRGVVPDHCCPDVPPWELCPHQAERTA